MTQQVAELEPRILWRYFLELARVPRCSKQEGAAVAWVETVAKQHGLPARRDEVGNLVVAVPASPGRENRPTVVMQSHLDMVCEKNNDVIHDFSRDPISPWIDGEWVRARGTTLGADNGIGVAAALALLDFPQAIHGPLELLFTVDEETGMTGAMNIQPGFFSGRYMINLDSEEIGVFTVGCAGGTDTTIVFRGSRSPADGPVFEVAVTGLMGGHSGTDIHKNRGNSLKILFRLLQAAAEEAAVGPLRVGRVQGGSKRNALPREARGRVGVQAARADAFRQAIEREADVVRRQLANIDEGVQIAITEVAAPADAVSDARHLMSVEDSLRFIRMMNALPHGVQGMDVNIPDLVETSCNVGVLADLGGGYQISVSGRSSLAPALRGLLGRIRAVARLAGAEATHSDGYPGWKPNLKSPLLARARDVHRRLFDRDATVRAIHAGLECGLLTEKYPDLDILSYGPDIQGAHSPDERVRIETVERMWTFTCALLQDLAS